MRADRASKLRALARRYHPDAHPNATAEEKAALAEQFAAEFAKLDGPSKRTFTFDDVFSQFGDLFGAPAREREERERQEARAAKRHHDWETPVLIQPATGRGKVHVAFNRQPNKLGSLFPGCSCRYPKGGYVEIEPDTPAARAKHAKRLCRACVS